MTASNVQGPRLSSLDKRQFHQAVADLRTSSDVYKQKSDVPDVNERPVEGSFGPLSPRPDFLGAPRSSLILAVPHIHRFHRAAAKPASEAVGGLKNQRHQEALGTNKALPTPLPRIQLFNHPVSFYNAIDIAYKAYDEGVKKFSYVDNAGASYSGTEAYRKFMTDAAAYATAKVKSMPVNNTRQNIRRRSRWWYYGSLAAAWASDAYGKALNPRKAMKNLVTASQMLRQAVDIDPQHADAVSGAAISLYRVTAHSGGLHYGYLKRKLFGRGVDPKNELVKAFDLLADLKESRNPERSYVYATVVYYRLTQLEAFRGPHTPVAAERYQKLKKRFSAAYMQEVEAEAAALLKFKVNI